MLVSSSKSGDFAQRGMVFVFAGSSKRPISMRVRLSENGAVKKNYLISN
ncbi:hypothetical protein [Flavobacterium columnare]|nr:hypothetical protein [Flavobacterium columnare]